MNPNKQPLHRFMLAFQTAFKGPQGQPGIKVVNTVISRSKKTVPLGHIKKAQDALVLQLGMFGIPAENVVEVAFLSCSYLGLMTDAEFHEGLSNEQAANVSLDGQSNGAQLSELGEDPLKIN